MSTTNPAWGTVADPVTDALEQLVEHGWRILHHTRWPGHPEHYLPHVAIGPGGVVVVMVPDEPVHGEVMDPLSEDLACATAAVTALVAPRHRRSVAGLLVTIHPTDVPTLAEPMDVEKVVPTLIRLQPRLSPLEVVLVSAYLRDRLDPISPHRTSIPQIPEPTRISAAEVPAPVVPRGRHRRRWWHWGSGTTTILLVLTGLSAPWVVGAVLGAL